MWRVISAGREFFCRNIQLLQDFWQHHWLIKDWCWLKAIEVITTFDKNEQSSQNCWDFQEKKIFQRNGTFHWWLFNHRPVPRKGKWLLNAITVEINRCLGILDLTSSKWHWFQCSDRLLVMCVKAFKLPEKGNDIILKMPSILTSQILYGYICTFLSHKDS